MVNAAFYPDTDTLQPKVNFTTLQTSVNATTDIFGAGGGFNTAFIFGDFGKAITVFMQMISGGYIVETLQLLYFPDYFLVPFQAIVGVMTLGGLIYLVSGRF
ncbi:hypothetical protein [Nitrososphaera sp.]|uniref:hypothetical protein n=1 Tax=Nitrososphaera sp. TaxID=1971748 RepID=UPI003D6E3BBB